jgi:hypothetical protein
MRNVDINKIIRRAWEAYDNSRAIKAIYDVSEKVSTNHVFKVIFEDRNPVFAKLSFYGKFEHFKEDHIIINNLANNLETPYENFLARSLMKNNEVFIYRYREDYVDAWVIFYNPIHIKKKLPRRLDEKLIACMGTELALFHRACANVKSSLPVSSKTITSDIEYLLKILDAGGLCEFSGHLDQIREQCDHFLLNSEKLNLASTLEYWEF